MMSGKQRRFDEETIDCVARCSKKWNRELKDIHISTQILYGRDIKKQNEDNVENKSKSSIKSQAFYFSKMRFCAFQTRFQKKI